MNESLTRLHDLVQLVDDGLTKKEFEDAFAAAVEHIRIIERRIMGEMETLRRKYRDLSEFTSVIHNLNTLKAEQRNTLTTMEAYVAALQDGAPGRDGKDGKPGAPGKNGANGKDGKDGKDGAPGVDGQTVDPKDIIKEVLARIPPPELPDYQPEIESLRKIVESNRPRIGWGAHPLTIQSTGAAIDGNARVINFTGSGVSSVVRTPDGIINVTLSGGGGGSLAEETPTGTINGSNKIFAFTHVPIALYLNGSYMAPTTDYTISGTTVTFGTAPVVTSIIRSLYLLGASPATTVYTETPTGTINGSNKAFTTLHSITSVFSFALNGQFIHPSEYSIAGSTITFGIAPDTSLSGTSFTIIYA